MRPERAANRVQTPVAIAMPVPLQLGHGSPAKFLAKLDRPHFNFLACSKAAMGLGQRYLLPGLIAQTQALQERRCRGILHGLVLCSGVLYGRDLRPCILLPSNVCAGISLGPDLCPRILHGPDLSVLFQVPHLWSGILRNLCWSILRGTYGPNLCPWILLGHPSLEFLEQGFG
jgi:hypothetical protein